MSTIAGHDFPSHGPCACGRSWISIRNATEADLNQPGIAHTGALNQSELTQIVAARQAEDQRIEAAMAEMSR